MWLDHLELQKFYGKPLGAMVNNIVGNHIRDTWQDISGMSILGLGFATPYLKWFEQDTSRIYAAILSSNHVQKLQNYKHNKTLLTHEEELPFADLSFDRIILIHCIENSEAIRPMMREIWRVLASNGKILAIVPNRRSIWTRTEKTPFGFGRPYSQTQLKQLLNDSLFTPTRNSALLYAPPNNARITLSYSRLMEKVGQQWLSMIGPMIGGLISIEASKEIYSVTPTIVTSRQRRYISIPNQH